MRRLIALLLLCASACFAQSSGAGGGTAIPSGIPASIPAQPSYAFNVSPLLMPHWTACTAKVKINTGYCRVFMVGDSTTYGLGSNGSLSTGDVTTGAYPTLLSKFLNTATLPAQRDAALGAGGGSGNGSACGNDNRVSCGGGWAPNGVTTVGGDTFSATATGTLAFTPTGQVDTFVFWYLSNTLGAGTYAVDGGGTTAFSEAGGSAIHSQSVAAGALGSHTLNLAWTSGTIYVIGFEGYNSALGAVRIESAGWSGSKSSDWNNSGSPWQPLNAVQGMTPDLVVIDIGINDWASATSIPTYTANIQAVITAWKVNSDVVLVTPVPSSIGTAALATQQTYVAALYQLAASNNIPLIDNFSRWGSYERANVAPLSFYFNTIHPDALGYSDFAQSAAQWLLLPVGK